MRDMDLEHPIITNMERTGYPDGIEPDWPKCPVCDSDADTFYYSKSSHEVVGCENCIWTQESWETLED